MISQYLNVHRVSTIAFKVLIDLKVWLWGFFRHILFKWFDFKQDVYIFSLYLEREALYTF